jgi:hypothetical protein
MCPCSGSWCSETFVLSCCMLFLFLNFIFLLLFRVGYIVAATKVLKILNSPLHHYFSTLDVAKSQWFSTIIIISYILSPKMFWLITLFENKNILFGEKGRLRWEGREAVVSKTISWITNQRWWCTLVIPAMWEVKVGGISDPGLPGQKCKTLSIK